MPPGQDYTAATNSLQDKTVVITGASSGAGRAIAIEFARHKAKIIIASRNIEALVEVECMCREMGALALAVRADVTDADQVKELAKIACEFGGSIAVWVNNAGVLAAGGFDDTPIEIHERVIKTNLVGYMHGAHAVLPYFKDQQQGIIINNISVGGWFPVPYSAAYSASKFGLRAFFAALRGELMPYKNIHVCDVYPAFLDTPGIQHAANYTGRALQPAPPVYDPQRLARVVVNIARRPRNSTTVGSISILLQAAYGLFPAISTAVTATVLKSYLHRAALTPATNGNLYEPANFGTSIHGGWNSDADAVARKTIAIKSSVAVGFALAFLLVLRHKLRKF